MKFENGKLTHVGKNNPMYGKHHSINTIHKIYAHRHMNKLEKLVEEELIKNNIPYYFQFLLQIKVLQNHMILKYKENQ